MSGFGKVTFKGEYFNQAIVNVFHFRSSNWLPLGGNPFDDVLGFLDAVISTYVESFRQCLPSDYTLRSVEGIGFDDAYNVVTASPLIREPVGVHGGIAGASTMGAAPCAIIGLRCGPQQAINAGGISKRNRGYIAVGPMVETTVDNYSHLGADIFGLLDTFAQHLDDTIIVPVALTNLIPVRIHEKWTTILGVKHLDWRTYSDVQGYRINAVASFRKSRQPEA